MDKRGLLDLCIVRLPNVSTVEKIRLCTYFEQEDAFVHASRGDIERIIGRSLKIFWNIGKIRAQAERDAAMAGLRGIQWVSLASPAYPPQLREIYDPPALLFFRGTLPNPEKPLAALVGTRRPSPQAMAQAFDIAQELGRNGIAVVSGLALGIDAMSHRGNLEGGGATVAVLGSGVDEVYPSANRSLAGRILDNGGALLSEYPPGMGPRKWNFPARNRIISGLARTVVIVEAPQASGALITAQFAADQGREVVVASVGIEEGQPSLFDRRGTAKLVADGAGLVSSGADILEEWGMEPLAAQSRSPAAADSFDMADETANQGKGKMLAASLAQSLNIEL